MFHFFLTGADRGLRLRLNIEQYEYMQGPNDGAGLKILIHDQNDVPMVKDLGLAVRPGTHTYVDINIIEVLNIDLFLYVVRYCTFFYIIQTGDLHIMHA